MNRYDVFGTVLLAALTGFVVLMAGVAYSVTRPKAVDPETLCPADGAVAHTVLLVDRSDPLGNAAVKLLHDTIERILKSLRREERFSILLIDSDGSRAPTPLFSRCAPPDGSDAHWLYENRRLLRRHWEAVFGDPVGHAARTLEEPAQAASSPIMETIQATTKLPSFSPSVGHRTLVIASDFLQNVAGYSHYRTDPDYDSFRQTPYAARVKTDLAGIEVELVYLPNPKAYGRQTALHRRFWPRYVSESGAASVRLIEQGLLSGRDSHEQCCG